ncbi:hypothetical protein sos41_31440 [Alphaproteobacteria bacterium SO-S41]|nr:hypothetical protein sos41_31440 [Alphaproteobacteria bacterium SO-S41]
MTLDNGDISLIVLGIGAVVGLITLIRSGFWRANDATKADSTTQAQLSAAITSLTNKVNSLPTAASFAAHDERLKAVEASMKDQPTGKQVAELTGAIDVLRAQLKGGLDTIQAEMRGAETARSGLTLQVNRIEQHLLDQAKTG